MVYACAKCSSTPSKPAGLARARGGAREEGGQDARQLRDLPELDVGDALAVAVLEVLALARREQREQRLVGAARAAPRAPRARPPRAASASPQPLEPGAVALAEREELAHEALLRRAPADAQEVDHLDQEARLAAGARAHHVAELAQPRHEALVPDAEERAARHVADARRLDDEHPGPAVREASVPVEHRARDVPVLGRAPRHHRRHPGARARGERADAQRREEQRRARLGGATASAPAAPARASAAGTSRSARSSRSSSSR